MIETLQRPQKRLFLALILGSLTVIAGLAYAFWRISVPGFSSIHVYLPHIIAGGLLVVFGIAFIGVVGIICAVMGLPTIKVCRKPAWTAINLLFPIAVIIGSLFKTDKEKIERSFIEVSNQIIKQQHVKVKPSELLVVTPHCLQESTCPHKITRDPWNCKRCGRCQVGELVALADKIGFNFYVVTGGTLARQTIKNIRPKAILAIACERDLTSGIQDVYPLPVVGVLNMRPCGPCNNTRVDMKLVEEAVRNFLE